MVYNEGKHKGTEIKEGDVVRVAGGYAKNNNGLFFVTDTRTTLWLCKLNKNGTISEADYNTQEFPPRCYASDPAKRAAAREQNKKATIEKAEGVNTFYVAQYFRKRAEERAEAARRYRDRGYSPEEIAVCERRAAEYAEIAERAEQTAEKPAEKAPEKGLKIYWNGMKIDGGKLIKCWYSPEENAVTIYADGYGSELPRQFFDVKNETDSMTDYFEKDHAVVMEDHPLYKYIRYAALKRMFTGHSYRKPTEAQRAEWATMKDPGQPTAKDLAEIGERRAAAENARKAREQAEAAEQRENVEQFPIIAADGGRIGKITVAPWVGDYLKAKAEAEREAKEQRKREAEEIMETVRLLTNEQLVAAVFAVDPKDKKQIDVARFFAQELARRDPKLAVDTFKKWSEGAGK